MNLVPSSCFTPEVLHPLIHHLPQNYLLTWEQCSWPSGLWGKPLSAVHLADMILYPSVHAHSWEQQPFCASARKNRPWPGTLQQPQSHFDASSFPSSCIFFQLLHNLPPQVLPWAAGSNSAIPCSLSAFPPSPAARVYWSTPQVRSTARAKAVQLLLSPLIRASHQHSSAL